MCVGDKDGEVIINETVKLNVGGYLFNPKVSILTKYDSLLKSMMKGEETVLMKEGYIFIDRCGKYFDKILKYLQDGTVSLPQSEEDINEFLTEVKYYRITNLISICQKVLKERKMKNIIKLNVGGFYFTTTKYTLTKCDSLLKEMIEEEHKTLTDSEGNIFIDRCGKHFSKILNFLRDGTIPLPKSEEEINELLAEAKFYHFSELTIECQKAIKKENPERIITLNAGGRLFITTYSTLNMEYSILHNLPSKIQNSTYEKDKDGNIFLDCSPNIFEHVLNYLLYNNISCNSHDELTLLMEESKKLQMNNLHSFCINYSYQKQWTDRYGTKIN